MGTRRRYAHPSATTTPHADCRRMDRSASAPSHEQHALRRPPAGRLQPHVAGPGRRRQRHAQPGCPHADRRRPRADRERRPLGGPHPDGHLARARGETTRSEVIDTIRSAPRATVTCTRAEPTTLTHRSRRRAASAARPAAPRPRAGRAPANARLRPGRPRCRCPWRAGSRRRDQRGLGRSGQDDDGEERGQGGENLAHAPMLLSGERLRTLPECVNAASHRRVAMFGSPPPRFGETYAGQGPS